MGRWAIALTATALVVVPVAISQVGSATSVVRVLKLGSGANKSAAVRCPVGSVAVSGGVQSPGTGTSVLAIRPSGSTAFVFRLANPADNPPQRVAVAVACRSLSGRANAPYFKASQARTRKIAILPGAKKQVSFSCPSGTLAAGAGFDLAGTLLQVRRQTQTLTGRSFVIRNRGTTARRAVLYATCLTLLLPPGSPRVRLQVSVTTATTLVQPGDRVLTQRCPRGWFSLATGYVLPAQLSVSGSAAVSGGGRWSVTNGGDQPALADLQLTCGRVA